MPERGGGNIIKTTSSSSSTGTITLDATAFDAFHQAFPESLDGRYVSYRIDHSTNQDEWEIGYGLYTHSGRTLTRPTADAHSGSGGLGTNEDFSPGGLIVEVIGRWEDLEAALPSHLTPEEFGAVGDGSTSDTAAFNAAIAEAQATGKLLKGSRAKTYYIGTSLNAFTSSLKIADCHFKAPNQVRLLFGNPSLASWLDPPLGVSTLDTTTVNQSTLTRATMASTSGLVVGDWVMIGSSTTLWPARTSNDVWWFESARIEAVVTNTSITLNRRLLLEEYTAISANLTLFKLPDYRLEADNITVEADGNVHTSGQSGREYAIHVRGGSNHRITNCHAISWWERFVWLESAVMSTVRDISWEDLPDIASEAFGYGVQETGACYGNRFSDLTGGKCRHGYSASHASIGAYSAASPWVLGVPDMSTISDSTVHGASASAFDSHKESARIAFVNCVGGDDSQSASTDTGAAHIFHFRGWRGSALNCTARAATHGFKVGMIGADFAATLGEGITTLTGCIAQDMVGGAIRVEGTDDGNRLVVSNLTATNCGYGISMSSSNPWGGNIVVNGITTRGLSSHLFLDWGGAGNVSIINATLDYAGQASASPPVRVDAIPTGRRVYDQITILRLSTSVPNGFFNVALAGAYAPQIGAISWDLDTLPMLSPSSHASASLPWTHLGNMKDSLWITDTHSSSGTVNPDLQYGRVVGVKVLLDANGTDWAPINVPSTDEGFQPYSVKVRFVQGGTFDIDLSDVDFGDYADPVIGQTAGDWLEVQFDYMDGVRTGYFVGARTA